MQSNERFFNHELDVITSFNYLLNPNKVFYHYKLYKLMQEKQLLFYYLSGARNDLALKSKLN